MKINVKQEGRYSIAIVHSDDLVISDVQSALDFIATVGFESNCDRIVLNKEAISEDFFKLSTCLAGDILQKFVNYGIKFAIVGDFSSYTSKPLKDFIFESNRGNAIFFVTNEEDTIEKLS